MDVIEKIREQQKGKEWPQDANPPEHKPEILFIGCVDARLDPIRDIGIPQGKALIKRCIAALVPPVSEYSNIGIAATLDLAMVMQVKHVVVVGHTDCGGIGACLADERSEHTIHLHEYLSPLDKVRERVLSEGGSIKEQIDAMERNAVRQSVENLKTYPVLKRALDAGEVQIHGWIIDTATAQIKELNKDAGVFEAF